MSVRVVGTRFFVRVNGSDVPIGVAEGRVEASTAAGRTTITAGQIARREADDRLVAERGDVAKAMAWREGKLILAGQPLSTVVAELNRYRHGRIVLMDRDLATRRFSGTLDLRDTDDALAVLSASMGLRITRVTPFLVLIRAPS